MIDLLETDRLKKAIEQSPTDFKQILEQTHLCVCITDENGNYVHANTNYFSMLGYQPEEMIGKSFLMVMPPETKTELSDLHEKFIEYQTELFRSWEIVDKQGRRIKISVDAGYSEKLINAPTKLTFVQPE
ncbi:MAG TPA: hypothetical protein DCM08_07235 [Microscillaceae bacterium]|jgi:two-component system CheB/CheR fusion protein|nr:hypothetical protein [Microscillaceae bacterium]